jgi:hypothetical protein
MCSLRILSCHLVLLAIWVPPAIASDAGQSHLRMLNDAYRSRSVSLPQGEMRVSIYRNSPLPTHDIYAVWQGRWEYVDIREYRRPEETSASGSRDASKLGDRRIQSVVGPEGTLVLHSSSVPGQSPVANISRNVHKPLLDGSCRLIPEPHVAWQQMSWGGQSVWADFLHRMTVGEFPVAVDHVRTEGSEVTLSLTNEANGLQWELTYSLAMEGRIVRYGLRDAPPTTSYDWERSASGRWYLKEYRHVPFHGGEIDPSSDDHMTIRVHEFSYEPDIQASRFQFSSIGLADGTIVYAPSASGGVVRERVVGESAAAAAVPSLEDLRRLSNLLRRKGFGVQSDDL